MDDALTYESLFKGANKFAHLALQTHRDGDEEVFVLHAGVSIERLLKATLAHTNPVLLMETGALKDDRALLHFAGVRLFSEKVRTVSASQALTRVRAAAWLPKNAELDELIELRNGVAHLGPTKSQSEDVLVTFASTTNQLLTHLGVEPGEYWADWARTIEISLNEQLETVERDVQRRIEQARHRFEDRFEGLPEEIKERALRAELAHDPAYHRRVLHLASDENRVVTIPGGDCPACTGTIVLILIETERTTTQTKFVPKGIACRLCDLELYGFEEMAALRQLIGGAAAPTMHISHGPTLPDDQSGETKAD